ncbi:MAG: hypothetical protein WC750_06650 [Patescibacteria group bacterium]|jgi:F0F1-type ATP synthase membrane subunit b/b'
MFIFAPQYWLFEALLLFVLFWIFFSFFLRNRTGRKIAREISIKDSPEAAQRDLNAAKDAAEEQLTEAVLQAREADERAKQLGMAVGWDMEVIPPKPKKE